MPRSNAKQFWVALGHVVKSDLKAHKVSLDHRDLLDPRAILVRKEFRVPKE
jgi:Cu/Ag efflux protein CusF